MLHFRLHYCSRWGKLETNANKIKNFTDFVNLFALKNPNGNSIQTACFVSVRYLFKYLNFPAQNNQNCTWRLKCLKISFSRFAHNLYKRTLGLMSEWQVSEWQVSSNGNCPEWQVYRMATELNGNCPEWQVSEWQLSPNGNCLNGNCLRMASVRRATVSEGQLSHGNCPNGKCPNGKWVPAYWNTRHVPRMRLRQSGHLFSVVSDKCKAQSLQNVAWPHGKNK